MNISNQITVETILLNYKCYKTRSCLDLKKQKEKKKRKKKNGSYHFEFSTQNEKLVAHASAPRSTSVCDKLTKKKYINKYPIGTLPAGHKNCRF